MAAKLRMQTSGDSQPATMANPPKKATGAVSSRKRKVDANRQGTPAYGAKKAKQKAAKEAKEASHTAYP